MTLNSFLNRLGLEDDDLRLCVSLAFAPADEGEQVLPYDRATTCLGWVAAVQEETMDFNTFCDNLGAFLRELGNPLDLELLESIAKYMLSGHLEPAESDR